MTPHVNKLDQQIKQVGALSGSTSSWTETTVAKLNFLVTSIVTKPTVIMTEIVGCNSSNPYMCGINSKWKARMCLLHLSPSREIVQPELTTRKGRLRSIILRQHQWCYSDWIWNEYFHVGISLSVWSAGDCAWNDDQLGVQSTCFIVSERKFKFFRTQLYTSKMISWLVEWC